MQVVPVERAGDRHFVRVSEHLTRLANSDGGPLPLLPGWEPRRVLLGIGRVSIAELENTERSQLAIWFLDRNLRFWTNTFANLPSEAQHEVTAAVPSYPTVPWDDIKPSEAASPDLTPTLDGVTLFNDRTDAEEASEFFRANDYVVIRSALTQAAMSLLTERIGFTQGNSANDPRQFYRVHGDADSKKLVQDMHAESKLFYEQMLGLPLLQTYGFAMRYIRGSDMLPHYDNSDNPISSTVCYAANGNSPLLLDRARFSNPFTFRVTVNDRSGIPTENVISIDLTPGDIAVFRGRQHLHWRDPITTELDYRAVLLHFSDVQYKGELRISRATPYVPHKLIDLPDYDTLRDTFALYFGED